MSKVVYEIVEHDGGFAYRVGATLSETFRSHDEARIAAVKAATEHEQSGPAQEIEFEDSKGKWHQEHADGADRPSTTIADKASDPAKRSS
jgi:hypothetical protein